jgi:U3 small nucleolar RNA-associated protein 25
LKEHGDNILMQNPSHLQHLADHLNLQPKEAHDCDFSRVRLWAAEGKSKYFRQNIILTHTPNEWFNSFMNQYSINMNGMVTMAPMEITGSLGVKNVPLPVPQLFQRIEGATRADAFKNRMKTFCKIIGDLVKAKLDGILIYIPSFYDFVKIRNYMEENSMKFLTLNEYSERAEAKRVRTMFENAEMPFLLFTERRYTFLI